MDADIIRLTSTALGELEMKLAWDTTPERERVWLAQAFEGYELVSLVGCSLDRSKGSNWVQEEGGLPEYMCEVAKSIHQKRGMPISQAIPIAIGVIQDWASGRRDVNADTRAKAVAAVAQWTKMRASAKAKK